MTNNAKIGGVLSIDSGAFGILWLLFFAGMAVVMMVIPTSFESSSYDYTFGNSGEESIFLFIAVIYIICGILYALVGALAIVGGAFALKKKYWGWSLAGAIAGNVIFPLCGIPATIFVSLGKNEFQASAGPEIVPVEKIVG